MTCEFWQSRTSGLLLTLPLKTINLGRQYGIQDWIYIGVENLVIRTRPLDEEKVTALYISEVLKLASIRESIVGLTQLHQGHNSVTLFKPKIKLCIISKEIDPSFTI